MTRVPPSFRWGRSLEVTQTPETHMQGMQTKEEIFTSLIILKPGERCRAFNQFPAWCPPSFLLSLPLTHLWLGGRGIGNAICMFSGESLYQISIYKDSANLRPPYAAQRDEAGQCVCSYIFQIPFKKNRVVFTFTWKQGKSGCPKAISSSM